MNSTAPAGGLAATPWTCPFCPLLCDTFTVGTAPDDVGALRLIGSDCPKARDGLAHFGTGRSAATPLVDGVPVDLATAVAAAAEVLGAARQPLFGGLATDVAGARALYRLACRTGAISDHAGGAALMRSTRSLQDKGAFTTTIAEIAERADLIVCVGTDPSDHYPEFFNRCKVGTPAVASGEAARHFVFLGEVAPPDALVAVPGLTCEHVPLVGDLYDTATALAAAVAGRSVSGLPASIVTLAQRLTQARYAVLVWETASLPAHGGLVVEALNRVVAVLNRSTRAAAFALGGGDGSASVNQTLTWLSGLPLRSRVGPTGLEHEPYAYDTSRLLAADAVDALLWISSFGRAPGVPAVSVPTVVLGHPEVAAPARGVYIPVATPGIGTAGHLFRVDSSSVLMPLHAVLDQGLPTVADVLARIDAALATKESATMNFSAPTTAGAGA